MLASLIDENTNPKMVRERTKKVKGDVGINGSMRVRNFNNKERSAMKAASSASKKEKDKALKGISKSVMMHERKFSTSEEVEECGALY